MLHAALGIGVATFVADRAFAEEVAAFHRAHPIDTSQQRVDQAIEFMLVGVAQAERTRPELDAILA